VDGKKRWGREVGGIIMYGKVVIEIVVVVGRDVVAWCCCEEALEVAERCGGRAFP
jgi:hypothetical protein